MPWLDTNRMTSNAQTDGPETQTWHRRHGQDVLVAMAVNPHTVHVYWDLDPLKQHLLQDHLGRLWSDIAKVLRVCDVTWITFDGRNAHETRDIHLNNLADNWYVTDLADGRDYVCLYGVVTNGEFFTLLRSGSVHTPRARAGSEHPRYAGPQTMFQPVPAKSLSQPTTGPESQLTTRPTPHRMTRSAAIPALPVLSNAPDWHSQFTGYSLQLNSTPTPTQQPDSSISEQPTEEQTACL